MSESAGGQAHPEGERLQKVMAAAGVASRRASENLIVAGRVSVNGEVVTELGSRIRPTDLLAVDGIAVQLDATKRYLMLNKPVGVVSSMADDRGRRDLSEYAARFEERLFNVGRLDAQTSGLLVLTNDGDLAQVLAHPSFGVTKTYLAKVEGRVQPAALKKLRDGVELDDGPIAADRARLVGSDGPRSSIVELTLHSGRNRIVRRMLAEVGHPVIDLVRRQFGPLHIGNLPVGKFRELTEAELGQLLTLSREGVPESQDSTPADGDARSGGHPGARSGQQRSGARSGNHRGGKSSRDGNKNAGTGRRLGGSGR